MPFITKNKIKDYYVRNSIYDNINEERNYENREIKRKLASKSFSRFDIFLSHSSLDKLEILALYKYLTRRYNFNIYIDWIVDPDLDRTRITVDTAKKIRDRMQQSEMLILAVSKNALLSNWTKWEVGYFDGFKERIGIMPIMDTEYEDFQGLEYLALYPVISEYKQELQVEDVSKYYGYLGKFNLKDW